MVSIRKGLFAALAALVPIVAAAPLVTFAAGCGSSDDTADDVPLSEKACLDTADAIAGSAERCGFDYQANFDAFVNAVANGDCANVIAVRDATLLYGDCIPALKDLTCQQVNDPNLTLPDTCNGQLLRQE
jgi:hypothetical protein